MMLIEQTTAPPEALPVTQFRDFLRLGTGFADDGVQDIVLETCLRAALAAIEARTGKIMLERNFVWSLTAWRDLARQVFPVAPVSVISSLGILDRAGSETTITPDRYRLVKDTHRPALVSQSIVLPGIPVGGSAEIYFTAGYGTAWSDIPPDLAHASLLLGSQYYEHRHDSGAGQQGFPMAVSSLIERYRNVRLFGRGL